MSAGKRIIHGNIASWCQIAVMLLVQIALVPVFLSRWDKMTYGVWIGIQTVTSMIAIPGVGFQEFLGAEFLRVGKTRIEECREILWSGFPIGIGLALIQILICLVGIFFGLQNGLLGVPTDQSMAFRNEVTISLAITMVATSGFAALAGNVVRALSSLGYYARISWWNVLSSLLLAAFPAVAARMGGGLISAAIATALAIAVYGIPQCIDMARILYKMQMGPTRANHKLGLEGLARSKSVIYRSVVERFRQTGVRLAIAPILGAGVVTDFTTMRTGANVMQQGLATLTGPVMPEMMHFANTRDQAKVSTSLATIWIVVIAVMTPATIILQLLAPTIFQHWLHKKVAFEPLTFAALSLIVLVTAVGQPAIGVVKGNNLLKPQVILSTGSLVGIAVSAVIAYFFQLPGFAFGLLGTEVVLTEGYIRQASKWFKSNELTWPRQMCNLANVSVLVAGICVVVIAVLPPLRLPMALLGLASEGVILLTFWRTLPQLARDRSAALLKRFTGKR